LPDADLEAVLPPTISGVLLNTGQTCIAPTRVLVQKDQVGEAIKVVKTIVESTDVGDPKVEGAHIGPVVNKAQHPSSTKRNTKKSKVLFNQPLMKARH